MSEATPHRIIEQQFVILPTWVLELPVSATALRVYCVIRSFADVRTGKCFPSRRLIAERAKCSIGSVDGAIRDLTAHGAISVRNRKGANGDWTSNIYTVHAQRYAQVAQSAPPPTTTSDTTGGTNSLTGTITTTNHNQYLLGYTLQDDLHTSQPTSDSAVVDQFLRASRNRSASI